MLPHYGYLKDQRYQLEKSMNTLPKNLMEKSFRDSGPKCRLWDLDSSIEILSTEFDDALRGEMVESGVDDSYRLKSYVMHLDAENISLT